MHIQVLTDLFREVTQLNPVDIKPLSAAGSNRLYFRLSNEFCSLIGVKGTSTDENKAFISLSAHFKAQNLNVPEVLAFSEDYSCYIQEDLGDTLLFDALSASRKVNVYTEKEEALLMDSMVKLADLQVLGDKNLDYSICYPQPEFNSRLVKWDLNYFKYDFLKVSGIEFREDLLEDEFEKLEQELIHCQYKGFMFRDFQSRNVMVQDEQVYFIDFQGGRKGPLAYDLASFLWQAKAAYPEELKEKLIQVYLTQLNTYMPVDAVQFRKELYSMVFFRLLQVLGAYGFRGLIEKKQQFVDSIPFALISLKKIITADYPYLTEIINQLSEIEKFKPKENRDFLRIKVYSFSYKKGIPEDFSGNGGGFVFDCRAVHNPGKYEEYKQLTGMDEPVQTFLEKDGEILKFLENVNKIVSPSVERYLKRSFTDLMISFGCTGGQHRSVYSAQKTAEFLHQKYDVEVVLEHREQGVKKILKSSRHPQ